MSPGRSRSFAIMNVAANLLLIPVLKSRVGRRLGERLAVVEYLGRRSGRRHRLVTQYVADERTVHIEVGTAERKTWWRNFRTPHPMRLLLAGADHEATARVVRDGDRVCIVAELDPPADQRRAHHSTTASPPPRHGSR